MGLYLGDNKNLKLIFNDGEFNLNIPNVSYTTSILGEAKLGYMVLSEEVDQYGVYEAKLC